eukprot:gene10909-7758_t
MPKFSASPPSPPRPTIFASFLGPSPRQRLGAYRSACQKDFWYPAQSRS